MNDWRINGSALRRACSELGIARPVRVRWATMDPDIGGHHHMRPDYAAAANHRGGKIDKSLIAEHLVTVKRGMSRRQTVSVMLHELKHAADREDDPITAGRMYDAASTVLGYENNPYERAAEAYAAEATDRYSDLVID